MRRIIVSVLTIEQEGFIIRTFTGMEKMLPAGSGKPGPGSIKESHKQGSMTVYLAGDSTVSDYDPSVFPRAGWGQVFQEYIGGKVTVANHAASGRSSKSFIEEGRLAVILERIQPGDYLFIQFGHNDQKNEDPARYTDPFGAYKACLMQYIEGARRKKAYPVFITPVERRRFSGKTALDTHGHYPQAMKEAGQECGVPVIDLSAKSKKLFEMLGPEKTKQVFLWLKEGESSCYPSGAEDNTHFQSHGAHLIAKLVAEEVHALKLPGLHSENGSITNSLE
ncbi:rhamnogalacturonan acetylesterase [Domibacillus indicus]|uniref:rhamnogalacturonan acetylesterase n=1 Tax=Domibacillus indicus TaxID=1437523 RepID=UPI000AB60EDE|nr:rhamnogalacturonan acetylesterase [Domibacillus indicus]